MQVYKVSPLTAQVESVSTQNLDMCFSAPFLFITMAPLHLLNQRCIAPELPLEYPFCDARWQHRSAQFEEFFPSLGEVTSLFACHSEEPKSGGLNPAEHLGTDEGQWAVMRNRHHCSCLLGLGAETSQDRADVTGPSHASSQEVKSVAGFYEGPPLRGLHVRRLGLERSMADHAGHIDVENYLLSGFAPDALAGTGRLNIGNRTGAKGTPHIACWTVTAPTRSAQEEAEANAVAFGAKEAEDRILPAHRGRRHVKPGRVRRMKVDKSKSPVSGSDQ